MCVDDFAALRPNAPRADATPWTNSERPIEKQRREAAAPWVEQALKMFGPLLPGFKPFFVDDFTSEKLKFKFSTGRGSKRRSFLVEYHPSSRA